MGALQGSVWRDGFHLSAFCQEHKKAAADVHASLPPQMPKVQYRSNCKPSTFAYPPALEIPKEKEKEKVSRDVLFLTFPPGCVSWSDICAAALFHSRPQRVGRDDEVLFILCVKGFTILRCVRRGSARLRLRLNTKPSLLCVHVAGIHRCSLHHSQSQEEGEGEERKGGGEDGSGKCPALHLLP